MRPVQTIHPTGVIDIRRWGGGARVGGIAWLYIGLSLWPASGITQTMDPLNTLLYTPAQRQAMNQARLGLRAVGVGATEAAVVVKPASTRLDGVVARERGRGTAWVNNEPVAQGSNPATRIQGTEAVVDGRRLRVGESFDNATGAKSDVVAPGAVRQRRSP